MKLIIQIPCYNEEKTLPTVLQQLPRKVPGFDIVEWLVIDDGSTDHTARIARQAGVDHIVRHTHNRGLARAFMTGIQASLDQGADVIVNTDADNQYSVDDIPSLTAPILNRTADLVVGARPIDSIREFSATKRLFQKLGSWVVRLASRTDVPDAPSGFRAMSSETARRLVVFNEYTYTLETLIQAGHANIAIVSVPVHVNPATRESRLMRGMASYIWRSIFTIIRIFAVYRPFRFFAGIGISLFIVGFATVLRFLYFYFSGDGGGHIQSLILAGVLLVIGFQTMLVAFLADLLAANRKLLEDIRYQLSLRELPKKVGTGVKP